MDRFATYQQLLSNSKFFKLVCGAGNENCEEVEELAFIYTLAGCKGFDISANASIIEACKRGIDNAFELSSEHLKINDTRPIITVSVGMPGDHHVRKAYIDPDKCIKCNLCIPTCPTDAIPETLRIINNLCIGCGNCEAVCPPKFSAISYKHNSKELRKLLPQCIEAGAESIELHAGVADDNTTLNEWQIVSDCVPNGMVSMCLDRYHLTNVHLIDRIRLAKEIAGDRLIIQADGIPMSGGTDDFNTTLQAIAIADIINKELKVKDRQYKKLPILISGGTNSNTGNLARQCGVNFSGITIGTHARSVIKPYIGKINYFENTQLLKNAVKKANRLIYRNLSATQQ